MVYGRYNELVNGVYKPTYNWGAPSCTYTYEFPLAIQSHAGYRFLINLLGWDSLSIKGFFWRGLNPPSPEKSWQGSITGGMYIFSTSPTAQRWFSTFTGFAAFRPCWKNQCGRREQNIHRPAILGYLCTRLLTHQLMDIDGVVFQTWQEYAGMHIPDINTTTKPYGSQQSKRVWKKELIRSS